eukprot:351289-Lingulodinium_polyedra.AAC.1
MPRGTSRVASVAAGAVALFGPAELFRRVKRSPSLRGPLATLAASPPAPPSWSLAMADPGPWAGAA